jgi:hypothetical protein
MESLIWILTLVNLLAAFAINHLIREHARAIEQWREAVEELIDSHMEALKRENRQKG